MKSEAPKYHASPYWGYVVIGCIATAVAAIVFGFSHYIIPTFKELFHGFGVELPALTQFFLTYYKFYLVVPISLAVLTICLSIPGLASKTPDLHCLSLPS